MSSFKLVSIIILVTIIYKVNCQETENDIPRSQGRGGNEGRAEIPFFGQCDRIAMKGVMDCMENFLPNRVFLDDNSGGLCCAYSKYKACILGLNDGLKTSMERAKCPRAYSTSIIMSFGENVVGFALRVLCERNDGQVQCPSPNTRNLRRDP